MKKITINIPDNKLDEFLKILSAHGFKPAEDDFVVPEWHKELVRERIKTNTDADYIPWEEVKKNLGIK